MNDIIEDNKILYYSIVISLLVHIALIAGLSIKQLNKMKKSMDQIEVVYEKINIPKKNPVQEKSPAVIEKIKMSQPKMPELIKKEPEKLSFDRSLSELSKFSDSMAFNKKETPKIATMPKERQIFIPMLKSEKMTNPKYVSYNSDLRQKIRQRAYEYVQDKAFVTGEVYLSFVLDASGHLKDVHIIESKTKADDFLKNVGLRSIKDASPFQPFPKDLNYPELTFNVIISFIVK